MTTTDEILALVTRPDASQRADAATVVTGADVAAFRATAARGRGSAVAGAVNAISPSAGTKAPGDPAWNAWQFAALAAADEPAGAARPAWCAVFGAAVAVTGQPGNVTSEAGLTRAIAAGLDAAAIVESGLADWDGWSSGTVAAVIGAGVTAGLLLGLAEPELRAAIAICATQAAGLRAAEGTDAFALQVGKAAFNGVEGALLARAGLTAPAEPLDGRRGLFALFGLTPR